MLKNKSFTSLTFTERNSPDSFPSIIIDESKCRSLRILRLTLMAGSLPVFLSCIKYDKATVNSFRFSLHLSRTVCKTEDSRSFVERFLLFAISKREASTSSESCFML